MTSEKRHILGTKLANNRQRGMSLPPAGPAFFTDPARRCSPDNADWGQWTSEIPADLRVAARKCREHCPFLAECKAWAIETGQVHYVYGGMNLSRAEERRAAKVERGLPPAPDGLSEADLVDAALRGNRWFFTQLSAEQQQMVVRGGRSRGHTWAELARRFRRRISELQKLSGEDGPTFDEQVAAWHAKGLSDPRIAREIGASVSAVKTSRTLQELPAVPRPSGPGAHRPVDETVRREIRRLWEKGLTDGEIALHVDRHPSSVGKLRSQMGLATRIGPGGRPRKSVAA